MKNHQAIQGIEMGFTCSQKWENLIHQEQIRHCQSCSKTVHDFSKYTDEEVLAFFENRLGENICGKFNKNRLDSLNRGLSVPPNKTFSKVLKPVLMAATISSVVACSSSKNVTSTHCSPPPSGIVMVENINNPDSLSLVLIEGTVVDKLGEPLIGASVIIDGLKLGTATDFNGNFQLKVPIQESKNDRIIIEYIGFESVPFSLKVHKNKRIKIFLHEPYLIGEIVIKAPLHKRLWWKIKRIFS